MLHGYDGFPLSASGSPPDLDPHVNGKKEYFLYTVRYMYICVFCMVLLYACCTSDYLPLPRVPRDWMRRALLMLTGFPCLDVGIDLTLTPTSRERTDLEQKEHVLVISSSELGNYKILPLEHLKLNTILFLERVQ